MNNERLLATNKILEARVKYQQDLLEFTRDELIKILEYINELTMDKSDINGTDVFNLIHNLVGILNK